MYSAVTVFIDTLPSLYIIHFHILYCRQQVQCVIHYIPFFLFMYLMFILKCIRNRVFVNCICIYQHWSPWRQRQTDRRSVGQVYSWSVFTNRILINNQEQVTPPPVCLHKCLFDFYTSWLYVPGPNDPWHAVLVLSVFLDICLSMTWPLLFLSASLTSTIKCSVHILYEQSSCQVLSHNDDARDERTLITWSSWYWTSSQGRIIFV